MVIANAHNTHYPTYTEDGITYVKNGTWTYDEEFGGHCEPWDVQKVDKPNDKTITIPRTIMINGEKIRIDGIRENAFATCTSLDSLIICDGIFIGNCLTFKGCRELKYLYYSNGGYCGIVGGKDVTYSYLSCKIFETALGCCEDAFWKAISGSLEKLIIRDTNRVNTRMDYCGKLKTIVCYAANPPFTCAARSPYVYSSAGCYISFEPYQWSTVTLYVPRESLEKYYFDRVWGEIDNIYAIDEMSVIDETDNTNNTYIVSETNPTTSINTISNTITDDVWYSLNGIKVNKPTKGVYIKNGKKYIIN
jgi:hypothetical protein